MSYDEMELDMIGDQRTALFIVISDTDDTFNFVVAMMYSQLFNLLCDRADDVHHGRLPYHVRILCDCKIMDAEISLLRIVAISLSNFGI